MSAVAMVVRMIGRLSAPTAAIWARFNPKPSRMTAYCSTFFAVKPMPSCTMPRAGCFHQRAMTMPMRMANTGPPTTGSAQADAGGHVLHVRHDDLLTSRDVNSDCRV